MKRILFLSLFFTLSVANFFAKEIPIEKDLYEYNNIVATLTKPSSPVVSENYIIFTAEASPRFVGIAFDFENYQTIHQGFHTIFVAIHFVYPLLSQLYH